MDIWTIGWLAWLGLFVVLEGVALARKAPDDTLSEHVWKWFGIGRPGNRPKFSGWVKFRRFALLAFLAWLVAHFLSGGAV
ncbi:hypothetical protein [Pilimelia terevasa]|uniref:hypothetical protein n=1 Tax=Pilimelia terevasa TaxID=53372 RepID=UPI001668ABA3|nr:hypothetical protein [Pilimelia terevasa]